MIERILYKNQKVEFYNCIHICSLFLLSCFKVGNVDVYRLLEKTVTSSPTCVMLKLQNNVTISNGIIYYQLMVSDGTERLMIVQQTSQALVVSHVLSELCLIYCIVCKFISQTLLCLMKTYPCSSLFVSAAMDMLCSNANKLN